MQAFWLAGWIDIAGDGLSTQEISALYDSSSWIFLGVLLFLLAHERFILTFCPWRHRWYSMWKGHWGLPAAGTKRRSCLSLGRRHPCLFRRDTPREVFVWWRLLRLWSTHCSDPWIDSVHRMDRFLQSLSASPVDRGNTTKRFHRGSFLPILCGPPNWQAKRAIWSSTTTNRTSAP